MDWLVTAVSALRTANKAMRDEIQIKDDEIGRLDHFEEQFRNQIAKYKQFKELAFKHEIETESLQTLLQQDLDKHRQNAEDLKIEIAHLKHSLDNHRLEYEKLESELNDNLEKLQKQNYSSREPNGGQCAIAFPILSSPNARPFIQRLYNDFK